MIGSIFIVIIAGDRGMSPCLHRAPFSPAALGEDACSSFYSIFLLRGLFNLFSPGYASIKKNWHGPEKRLLRLVLMFSLVCCIALL